MLCKVTRTYQIGEQVLASNLAFPELEPGEERPIDLSFELLPPVDSLAEPTEWFWGWPLSDEQEDIWWLRFAEVGGEYLLRFPDYAEFRVAPDGARIRCRPLRDIPAETLRHLLLDQVLPLALSLDGGFVLHASGVKIDERAIGVVGMAGRGKSTLAASFAAAGFSLLTDDCLILQEDEGDWHAVAYYPGIRLWPDNLTRIFPDASIRESVAHYTHKQRLSVRERVQFSRGRVPLSALFFLRDEQEPDPAGRIAINPLTSREAFVALLNANFLLEIRAPAMLRRQFDLIARLIETVPCFGLEYPREHLFLPKVKTAIVDWVAKNSGEK